MSFPEIVEAYHGIAKRLARTKKHRGRKLAPAILLQCLVLDFTRLSREAQAELVDRNMPLLEAIEDADEPIELAWEGPPQKEHEAGHGLGGVSHEAALTPKRQRKPKGPHEAVPARGRAHDRPARVE
jgi:hypothetical protein